MSTSIALTKTLMGLINSRAMAFNNDGKKEAMGTLSDMSQDLTTKIRQAQDILNVMTTIQQNITTGAYSPLPAINYLSQPRIDVLS